MLGDQELEETKSHSKAFHRAVSAQEKAKKELVKVQTSRRNFLTAWGGYVDKLQSLLKQQLEEQEKTLASFGQHEQKWQQQLVEANKELATFSAQSDGTAQHVSSDSDVDLRTDGPSEDPWSTDNAAKLKNQQIELAAALSRAKEKAEALSKEVEGRERTPRRKDRSEGDAAAADPPPPKASA